MSEPRYKIIDGSKSAHCCFEFTIVDTHKPEMLVPGKPYIRDGVPQFETICECFEHGDADLVLAALNASRQGVSADEPTEQPAEPPGARSATLTRDELLVLLIEEASEIIQAATKCQRFGYEHHHPGYGINCEVLASEIGDLLGVIDALAPDPSIVAKSRAGKIAKAVRVKAEVAALKVKQLEATRCQWPDCDCAGKYADCKIDGHPIDD